MMLFPHRADALTRSAWRCRGGILAELADFLDEWDSPCPTVRLQTSGSTGEPTVLQASKSALRASAAMSCRAFGLHEGNTALLCLPLRYIAGKMMVVRALVAHLRLVVVEPCADPLAALEEEADTPSVLDFAPMVPMQAIRCLAQAGGAERLSRVRTLLLGGGFIDPALEAALQGIPSCRAFASYGMTETFSHIALRRLNGEGRSEAYTPLPGVELSLSAAGTLCICAPQLGIEGLETNDLAELLPGQAGGFRILGRRDAVINSGGVKIQAEELEHQLHAATGLTLIAVALPHAELGHCVALLWEGPPSAEARLHTACEALPRYHRPRLLRRVEGLPRTATGKLARAACRELAASLALGA